MPRRIGTAPLRPAKSTKARSPRSSLIGSETSPTRTGRTMKLRSAATAEPDEERVVGDHGDRITERPRTTKATISARLASAPANSSMSRLKGARVVAHDDPGEEDGQVTRSPPASRPGRRERTPSRGSAAGAARRSAAAPGAWRAAAPSHRASPTASPTAICREKVARPLPTADQPPPELAQDGDHEGDAHGVVGPGLTLDQGARAAAISRRPSTEKTTAGSVGARAAPRMREVRQSRPTRLCTPAASAAVVTAGPGHAEPEHSPDGGAASDPNRCACLRRRG